MNQKQAFSSSSFYRYKTEKLVTSEEKLQFQVLISCLFWKASESASESGIDTLHF